MKKYYMKPTMKMAVMSNEAELLAGSPYDTTPPNEVPDYDDWLGSRSDSNDRLWNDPEDELNLSDQGVSSSIWDR